MHDVLCVNIYDGTSMTEIGQMPGIYYTSFRRKILHDDDIERQI